MAIRRYSVEFYRLRIGSTFRQGATTWIKKSTKTARPVDSEYGPFYFSRNDICVITDLDSVQDD